MASAITAWFLGGIYHRRDCDHLNSTDSSGAIDYVNPALTEKRGTFLRTLLGPPPHILHAGDMPAEDYDFLW